MEHTGLLTSVEGRQTAKGTVFEAECGGKKFSTWKEDVAAVARPLIGQVVKIEYATKTSTGRNGQVYENNTLFHIAPTGEQLPPDASRDQVTSQAVPTPAGPVVVQSTGMPPDREARIVRQSAMKIAFGFVGDLTVGTNPDEPLTEDEWNAATDRALALAADIYKLAWGGKADESAPLGEPETQDESPDSDS